MLLGNQERGDIKRKNNERRCDSEVSFPKSTNNDKIDTAVPLLVSAPPPAATFPADNQRQTLSSASNTVIHDSDTAIAKEIFPTEDGSSSIASDAIPAEKKLLTEESSSTTLKKMATTGQSKHSSNGNGNGGCVDHSSNSTFGNNGGYNVDGKEKKKEEDTKQAKSDDSSNNGFSSGTNKDDSIDHDETRDIIGRIRDDQKKNKEEKTKQAESDESSDGVAERRKTNNDDGKEKPHADNNNHHATHTGPRDISNKDNITSSGRSKDDSSGAKNDNENNINSSPVKYNTRCVTRKGLGDKTNTDAIGSKASVEFGRSDSLAASNDEENNMNKPPAKKKTTDIEEGHARSSTFSSISKNAPATSTIPSNLQDSNHVREEEDGVREDTKEKSNDNGSKTKCVSDVEGNNFNKDTTSTLERVLATTGAASEAASSNEDDGFDFPSGDSDIEEIILAETNTNSTTMTPTQPSSGSVPPPVAILPTTTNTPAVKALPVCPLSIPSPSSVPVPIRSPVLTTTSGSTSSREGAQHEADGRLDVTSKSSGRGSTHESATDIDRKRRALMGTSSKRDSSEIGFATNAESMSSKTPVKKGAVQNARPSDSNPSVGDSNEDTEQDDRTSDGNLSDGNSEISTKSDSVAGTGKTFTELQSETESKTISISSSLIAASTNADDPDDSDVCEVSTAAFSDGTVPNSAMDAEATNTDNINPTNLLPLVAINQRAPANINVDPTVHEVDATPAFDSTMNPDETNEDNNNNDNDNNNNNNSSETRKEKARKARNKRRRNKQKKNKQNGGKGNKVNHHGKNIETSDNFLFFI